MVEALLTAHALATRPRLSSINSLYDLRTTAAMPKQGRSCVFFPRQKEGEEKPRPVSITLSALEGLYHLPAKDAAREVGLCLTTFKKALRRFHIEEWPFRKGQGKHGGQISRTPSVTRQAGEVPLQQGLTHTANAATLSHTAPVWRDPSFPWWDPLARGLISSGGSDVCNLLQQSRVLDANSMHPQNPMQAHQSGKMLLHANAVSLSPPWRDSSFPRWDASARGSLSSSDGSSNLLQDLIIASAAPQLHVSTPLDARPCFSAAIPDGQQNPFALAMQQLLKKNGRYPTSTPSDPFPIAASLVMPTAAQNLPFTSSSTQRVGVTPPALQGCSPPPPGRCSTHPCGVAYSPLPPEKWPTLQA